MKLKDLPLGTHLYRDDIEGLRAVALLLVRECKKICVSGILTTLLKGQQNANIRRAYCSTS